MSEEKIDYLDVDDTIPGQNFVCLSFVSPETMIESKESFKVAKFLQSVCKEKDMDFNLVMNQYKDFTYRFGDELQRDYDKECNMKTNIRGVKVRGTYSTREEAERRAKKLQGFDSTFHVFVGQVGYWLPWDPCADGVENEEFIENGLNDMMKKYKENSINKDIMYEQDKREKVKRAREEAIEAEKNKQEKATVSEDNKLNKVVEDVEQVVEDVEQVVEDGKKLVNDVEEVIEDVVESVGVDTDLQQALDGVDPWMANKINNQSGNTEPEPEPNQ
jgi:hypothetical protein